MGKEYRKIVDVRSTVGLPIEMLFVDDFESPLSWALSTDTDKGRIEIQTVAPIEKGGSLFIIVEDTTPAADLYTTASRVVPTTLRQILRLTMAGILARVKGAGTNLEVQVNVTKKGSTQLYRVRYDQSGKKLQYYDSGGEFSDIPGGDIALDNQQIFDLELRMDLINKKYLTLRIGSKEYDLSAYAVDIAAAAANLEQTEIRIRCESSKAANTEMDVDNVVLLNELA